MLRTIANLVLAGLLLPGLVACGRGDPPVPPPASRPVKLFTVEGGRSDMVRSFPGRVQATRRAELSFRVSGQLQEILVKEGDLVEAGQVLARLDPADYEVVFEDRQASFDNARRNFARAKELVADGNISRIDFDRMEAEFRSASAALSQAELNLEYTVLTSPFKGRIAQRRVENFEDVRAQQTVFWLQNIDQLDVIIDLPESVVRSVQSSPRRDLNPTEDEEISRITAFARFEGRSETRFPLRPKEIATQADPQTQTFRATFTMDAPSEFTVLPGMTANVNLDLTGAVDREGIRWVPARAVQADSGLKPRVWVLDPATMTVESRAVEVGRMSGRLIQVFSGLEGGEEIVAVGAPYLAEGMKVTRMAQTEQAVPRADDPL
jgi:RND family efflux transporter MFP subunit